MGETIFEVSHLTAYQKDIAIVKDVSFSLQKGEILGIAGQSGCGKTTLLRSLLLLPKPGGRLEGEISFLGQDLLSQSPQKLQSLRGREIAMVPQNAGSYFDPTKTISSLFWETCRIHKTAKSKEESDRLACAQLALLGLTDGTRILQSYPFALSGGQCQRVALALALSQNPKILLADEPTSALDVASQNKVMDLLEQKKESRDMAIVLVSHHIGLLAHLSDRLAVMYGGEWVEYGPAAQVQAHPIHPYTKALFAAVPKGDGANVTPLEGEAPSFSAPLPGCSFAPRCPKAKDICHQSKPPKTGNTHWARCFLAEKKEVGVWHC